MNAHTEDGFQWLEEVVVNGIREGGGESSWKCEVHGNDGVDDNDSEGGSGDEEGDGKPSGPPSGSPGPCVYIIQKLPPTADPKEGDDTPTIPIKFFVY